MIQNPAQVQAVETMEELIGRGDWENAGQYFTPEVMYKVAAREAVYGLTGIHDYMQWQNQLVLWQGHTIRLKANDNDIVIIEADSHFLRLADGASITIPCTDIYRMNGLRISEWRVYADISLFQSIGS